MSNNQANLERTILASYFLMDLTPDAFKNDCRAKLDTSTFIMPFHRKCAERINKAIDDKEPLPYVFTLIQDKISGTVYENELLLIEATYPLSNGCGLNWYIDRLKHLKIERELGHE